MSTPPLPAAAAASGAQHASASLLPWRRSWWRTPNAAQAAVDVVAEVVAFTGVVVLAGAAGNPDQRLDEPFWLVFLLLLVVVTVVRSGLDARRERASWSDLAWRERASPEQLDAAERVVRAGVAPSSTGEAVLALGWAATAERTHGWRAATWVLAPGLAVAVALQPLFGGSWSPSWTPSWVAGAVAVVAGFVVARGWRRGLRRRQGQLREFLANPVPPRREA